MPLQVMPVLTPLGSLLEPTHILLQRATVTLTHMYGAGTFDEVPGPDNQRNGL